MSLNTPTEPAALDAGVPTPQEELRSPVSRQGSLGGTVKAVAWAFFGVRGSAQHRRDMQQLNPVHVVIAGLLGAVAFVVVLVLVVQWVTTSGVAR